MADLDFTKSGVVTTITGADSTGVETNMVNSTTNGDLQVVDIPNTSGVNGAITVGTSAVAARVGGTNLAKRKTLSIFHNGNGNLFWGTSNGVTTANGTQIFKNTSVSMEVGENITIYLIASNAGNDVRIVELS